MQKLMNCDPNLYLEPSEISLFTSRVLCDVFKTLLEPIEALCMLFGPFEGVVMV